MAQNLHTSLKLKKFLCLWLLLLELYKIGIFGEVLLVRSLASLRNLCSALLKSAEKLCLCLCVYLSTIRSTSFSKRLLYNRLFCLCNSFWYLTIETLIVRFFGLVLLLIATTRTWAYIDTLKVKKIFYLLFGIGWNHKCGLWLRWFHSSKFWSILIFYLGETTPAFTLPPIGYFYLLH